jgi:hypothetical protein
LKREGSVKDKRKTVEQWFGEMLAEQKAERRLPMVEWVKKRLGWEDWQTLMPKSVRFAATELKRRRGRASGEVLPGGYDMESIAGEAIINLLEGKGRLASGWTRERLVKEIERLIRRRVRLLASLKEGRVTQGGLGFDLTGQESELTNAAEQVPDGGADGYEAAVAREEMEARERLKWELERSLESEPELVEVFRCLWAGMTKPAEVARRIGIDERTLGVLRKRLERRFERFRGKKRQSDAKATKDSEH